MDIREISEEKSLKELHITLPDELQSSDARVVGDVRCGEQTTGAKSTQEGQVLKVALEKAITTPGKIIVGFEAIAGPTQAESVAFSVQLLTAEGVVLIDELDGGNVNENPSDTNGFEGITIISDAPVTPPTNVIAEPIAGENDVRITWDVGDERIQRYEIYADGEKLSEISDKETTSYTHISAEPKAAISYTVIGAATGTLKSNPSSAATATVGQDTTPPQFPIVRVDRKTPNMVKLTWTPSSQDAVRYFISRGASQTDLEKIAEVGPDKNEYVDETMDSYVYAIGVQDDQGNVAKKPLNRALFLDGDGDYVRLSAPSQWSGDIPFTVSFWMRYSPMLNRIWIMDIGTRSNPENRNVHWLINPDGGTQFGFWGFADPTGNQSVFDISSYQGQWVFVSTVYAPSSKSLKTYLNGTLTSSDNMPYTPDLQPDEINIGLVRLGAESYFNGLIDEVRIWNIDRTQEEIQATMNTTLTGQEEGLVGYWNFDDGTVKDLSPNGNDGTLHGDARIIEASLPDEFIHQGINIVALEDKIVNPDDQFAMNISVRLAEELHSFTFDLTFDPEVLQAVSVKEGPFLSHNGADATSWQIPTIDNTNGVISNIRCSRSGKDGVKEKGVLATVTFEVSIEMGSTDLTLKNLRLLSPTGEEMKASARKGKVDVYPHGSISGAVLDLATKKPIKGAKVEVSKGNFTIGVWTHSGHDGIYTLKGVPVGNFDVTASKDDYISETISKVHVEQGKTTPDINIEITSFDTASTITIPTPIDVGETAPDFTLSDIAGKQISLSDFKGKPIIINFWDSTSSHCRRQIEHLDALYKKYQDSSRIRKNSGLVVIGINKEIDHDAVLEFAKGQISYIVLMDGEEAFTAYGVSGIPCTYYIDKAGKVHARDVGFPSDGEEKMEQRVKKLLEGN